VFSNRLDGRGGIGIDQPELDAARRELLGEPLELGRITVRNGAIRAYEQEDARVRGRLKWIARISVDPGKRNDCGRRNASYAGCGGKQHSDGRLEPHNS
jgi:hypothetical protein